MANAKAQRPNAVEITSNYTVEIEWDASNNPIYVGYADIGTSTSATGWAIRKITWDASNNPLRIQWADGTETHDKNWANRKDGTYTYS